MRFPPSDVPKTDLTARLPGWLFLARLVVAWERLWPVLMPLSVILALFLILAFLDLLPALPAWGHVLAISGFAGAFGYLAWLGFSRLGWPSVEDAARRLERDSGLDHRPLAVLADRLATRSDDPLVRRLWEMHVRRVASQVGALRLKVPSPGMGSRDRPALAIMALALLAALWAGRDVPLRLARALSPAVVTANAGGVEAWINPPASTGLAPIHLDANSGPAAIPAGSTFLGVLAGGRGRAELVVDNRKPEAFQQLPGGGQRIEATIQSGRMLTVRRGFNDIAKFPISVVADQPPMAGFARPLASDDQGRLGLSVEASDDYGLTRLWAEIRPLDPRAPADPLTVDLARPTQKPRRLSIETWQDLASHPWAGLPVRVRIGAEDSAGQRSMSDAQTITLPEREFTNPVARKVVEQRRLVTEDQSNAAEAASVLGDILADPGSFKGDLKVALTLGLARSLLSEPELALAEVQDLMWNAALRIEDGDVGTTARALEDAAARLRQAMDSGASAQEIQRLLNEYEAALRDALRALAAQQPQEGGGERPADQVVSQEDLMRMMESMRAMAEAGSQDALRHMLSQMSQLMAGLKAGAGQAGQSPEAAAAAELQGLARSQQRLLDRSVTESKGQQQGSGDPQGQSSTTNAQTQAGAQERLRQSLEGLSRRLGQLGGAAPSAELGEAGQAMAKAVEDLSRSDWKSAAESQTQALERLREGSDSLGSGGMAATPARDPFGRPLQGVGFDDYGDTKIPQQADMQRSREILDELRRRSGDWSRPEPERNYLDRLLKQF